MSTPNHCDRCRLLRAELNEEQTKRGELSGQLVELLAAYDFQESQLARALTEIGSLRAEVARLNAALVSAPEWL